MDLEIAFSVAGVAAMIGWLALLASPLMPVWSDRIAGYAVPLVLSLGYAFLSLVAPPTEGGFASLAEVQLLFAQPMSLLAGWVHFLAFDLLIGAWACRTARRERIAFWLVVPCLVLTFLLGPAGFLAFCILRAGSVAFRRENPIG